MPLTAALAGDLTVLFDTLWSAGVALTERARKRQSESCEVSVAEGADAVTLAAPAWRGLERAGGAATPFQTHAMAARLSDAHLRRGETPRIVVVHDDSGRPVVVLPTVVARWGGVRTVRFLGDPLVQYGDALAAPDASDAHLDQAWRVAADPGVAPMIYLRNVRADARIATTLARHAAVVATGEAPHVDPAASVPSARARELRRLRRRLEERGPVSFAVLQGSEAGNAMREAIALKREWLAERGASSAVIGDKDWEAALLALAIDEDSPLRVARLSVGDRTAAIEIGLAHDGRWCAFLGALAPDFAKAGPGQVQMADTVAHCREAGITCYDLMAPADPYKTRMAHGSVAVHCHAAALSPAGWPGLLLARMRPVAKRLAAAMPAPARQIVQALRAD